MFVTHSQAKISPKYCNFRYKDTRPYVKKKTVGSVIEKLLDRLGYAQIFLFWPKKENKIKKDQDRKIK